MHLDLDDIGHPHEMDERLLKPYEIGINDSNDLSKPSSVGASYKRFVALLASSALALIIFYFAVAVTTTDDKSLFQWSTSLILLKSKNATMKILTRNNLTIASKHYFERFHRYFDQVIPRLPPVNFDKWVEFATIQKCHVDLAQYQQIYNDLDPFFKIGEIRAVDYSTEMKDKWWHWMEITQDKKLLTILDPMHFHHANDGNIPHKNENGGDVPFIIPSTDGYASTYSSASDVMLHNDCMQKVPNETRNANGFYLGPNADQVMENKLIPFFSQNKEPCYKDILLPLDYHSSIYKIDDSLVIPWDQKKNVLFWRGATTGGAYLASKPWRMYHRTRLVQWAKSYLERHPEKRIDVTNESQYNAANASTPLRIDIAFKGLQQIDHEVLHQILGEFGEGDYVKFEKTVHFKYLVIVDGNGWPARLQSYLQTGSVILYNGIFLDWYSWKLKPWIHYIPIRLDLLDLEERLDWLGKNDEKARAIAENARIFMLKHSEIQHMQCYTSLLLLEYIRLFKEY